MYTFPRSRSSQRMRLLRWQSNVCIRRSYESGIMLRTLARVHVHVLIGVMMAVGSRYEENR
ncbi:hypothetical protein CaCOL14_010298 [Colletotrichum acutatum]